MFYSKLLNQWMELWVYDYDKPKRWWGGEVLVIRATFLRSFLKVLIS